MTSDTNSPQESDHDTDCEICNSDWYKNIDYSKLRPVTDEEREQLRKLFEEDPPTDI